MHPHDQPLQANHDAGPIFFLLGALFPTGKCMDDEDIACNPEVWADRTKIVGLYIAGQTVAHNKGFALHLLSDFHSSYLLRGNQRAKIPDLLMLDPDAWPAQGYLKRFLTARAEIRKDVDTAALEECRTLRHQYEMIANLNDWVDMGESGTPVRVFLEGVMHIMQLQFFGVPAEKVSYQIS
jgi:hypothetical protein